MHLEVLSFTSAPSLTPALKSLTRVDECRIFDEVLLATARKFRAVKFVKITATAAVENWPDRNLPTLFIYHDGELKHQLIGIKRLGGKGVRPVGACGGPHPLLPAHAWRMKVFVLGGEGVRVRVRNCMAVHFISWHGAS
jgi:hypothetical protein